MRTCMCVCVCAIDYVSRRRCFWERYPSTRNECRSFLMCNSNGGVLTKDDSGSLMNINVPEIVE